MSPSKPPATLKAFSKPARVIAIAAARERAPERQRNSTGVCGPAPASCNASDSVGSKIGIRLHGGKGLPLDAMRLAPEDGEVGQADKIPFGHRANINQLCFGVLFQKRPCLGKPKIACVFGRRGR